MAPAVTPTTVLTRVSYVYILLSMRDTTTPLERGTAAADQCTCFNLRKASRAISQVYDDILRPSGLRITQYSLLMVIRRMGTASITQLAEQAVMDRTTLARNLALLEGEGLVLIEAGADARVREVSLNAAAHDKLATAVPYWEKAQARVARSLGAARIHRLLGDLSAAVGAAQDQ